MDRTKYKYKTTVADYFLMIFFAFISLYGFVFINKAVPQGTTVNIEVDGKLKYILPLSTDKTIQVEGITGKTIIQIKNKSVRITESPCPNKLCIHQGWTARGSLLCIPNRVLVITSNPDNGKDIDGITG